MADELFVCYVLGYSLCLGWMLMIALDMRGSPIGRQCLRLELCIATEMTFRSAPALPLG